MMDGNCNPAIRNAVLLFETVGAPIHTTVPLQPMSFGTGRCLPCARNRALFMDNRQSYEVAHNTRPFFHVPNEHTLTLTRRVLISYLVYYISTARLTIVLPDERDTHHKARSTAPTATQVGIRGIEGLQGGQDGQPMLQNAVLSIFISSPIAW